MPWGRWMITLSGIVWIGLTGCSLISPKPEPAFCEASVAYTKNGTADTLAYQVPRACLRWMNQRLAACHKE